MLGTPSVTIWQSWFLENIHHLCRGLPKRFQWCGGQPENCTRSCSVHHSSQVLPYRFPPEIHSTLDTENTSPMPKREKHFTTSIAGAMKYHCSGRWHLVSIYHHQSVSPKSCDFKITESLTRERKKNWPVLWFSRKLKISQMVY